ncbi:MAG: 16S rRNA processing protein RimM [Sterolibacteriaceae bacterium]|uniref:ribosome maturation factor RimM n=1 Tax=Sulfuritalea sp. TaxID=2480090 RepID=UPI001A5C0E65|nr:ribosome maturation factor RimM [Sulfuritalea sp.]MBL8479653.1 16S rRNA processing protein RimM [Sterolibacteriaceae bacterium]MBN8473384.1 16S rRNA processing protein RimM [Sulfuritalea sp.]
MIVLGRIVAPFGVQGWLRVHPFGDDPEAWRKMRQWWLSADADAPAECWTPRVVEAVKLHGDGVVAKLSGIDDRDASEALGSCYFGASREDLPAPAQDEYYWADLIGLDVVNLRDQPLGRVRSLIETGANEVLVVTDGERERLLPFVEQVIKKVDIAGKMVRVDWDSDW